MLILYVAMKYDYGMPERGYGFEHYNFYDSLRHMGHEILYFDFMTLITERGQDGMNQLLRDVVKSEKPALMFSVMFKDELDQRVVQDISEDSETATVNWFCDDHWRFEDYSSRWAPCFNWSVTTAPSAISKYDELGYRNVIKSQWACNHYLYKKLDLEPKYDVSFVGQRHGNRSDIINSLRRAGVSVHAWGTGWEGGRISQDEMIRVFNESRINLNLSNAFEPVHTKRLMAERWLRKRASSFCYKLPFGAQVKALGNRCVAAIKGKSYRIGLKWEQYVDQIKGRTFEIPGSGGFLLTGEADGLDSYYDLDNELVSFRDVDELIQKARHYLKNEEQRKRVADTGYRKTISCHTYAHRFDEIFKRIGLRTESLTSVLEGRVRVGQTVEIG